MARVERLNLTSERDGLEMRLLLVLPEGSPRAIVQFSHGMCEHKDRYQPFMEYLAAAGYVSVINDHRGHGAVAQANGDLGFFGKDGAQALVDDLYQITRYMHARFPGLQLYLFGHSMGSLAVRAYAAQHEDALDGLFVCGSPSYNAGVPLGRLLAKMSGAFRGGHHRSKLLKIMTFGPFYRAFPQDRCAWICSDDAVVRAYNADPLCGFSFTCNGYDALFSLMQKAYDTRRKAVNPTLPIHFLSGQDDPCRMGEKGFSHAVACMKKRGYSTVTATVYPGMRHEILNETDRNRVWSDVLEILDGWVERP